MQNHGMIFYSIKQLQTIVGFAIITDSDININANSRESNVYTYVRMCGKIVLSHAGIKQIVASTQFCK